MQRSPTLRRPGPRSRLLLIGAGLTFGALTSAANHGVSPAAAYISKLLDNGGVWLAAGLLACLAGRTWRIAAVRSATFYLAAVASYYVGDAAAGVYTTPSRADPFGPTQVDFANLAVDLGFYLALGLVTSCLLATLVVVIHRGGVAGVIAAIAVPGYIAFSAISEGLRANESPIPTSPIRTQMTWTLGLTAAVVTGIVLIWRVAQVLRGRTIGSTSSPSTP